MVAGHVQHRKHLTGHDERNGQRASLVWQFNERRQQCGAGSTRVCPHELRRFDRFGDEAGIGKRQLNDRTAGTEGIESGQPPRSQHRALRHKDCRTATFGACGRDQRVENVRQRQRGVNRADAFDQTLAGRLVVRDDLGSRVRSGAGHALGKPLAHFLLGCRSGVASRDRGGSVSISFDSTGKIGAGRIQLGGDFLVQALRQRLESAMQPLVKLHQDDDFY
jgi:hypothetical protein